MTVPHLILNGVTELRILDETDHGDFRAVHLEIRDVHARLLEVTLMTSYKDGAEVHFGGLRWDPEVSRLVPAIRNLSETRKLEILAQQGKSNVT